MKAVREDRTWEQCVKAAQEAIQRTDTANWEIGKAALEAVPPGQPGRDSQVRDRLIQFASDVGMEFTSIERSRSIRTAWPLPDIVC